MFDWSINLIYHVFSIYFLYENISLHSFVIACGKLLYGGSGEEVHVNRKYTRLSYFSSNLPFPPFFPPANFQSVPPFCKHLIYLNLIWASETSNFCLYKLGSESSHARIVVSALYYTRREKCILVLFHISRAEPEYMKYAPLPLPVTL